jgi:CMP-2-keto-3-deoxyoctulosonic acid synthetase
MKIAVIPARGGSKRIPRKNIKSFAGKPMITHAIGVAQSSGLFDHIVVSTDDGEIAPLAVNANELYAYHLYVVKIDFKSLGIDRIAFFTSLRGKGIAVNVHYIPVHLHPFYREKFHAGLGSRG